MSNQHTWNGDERRKGERRTRQESYHKLSNQLNNLSGELNNISNDIREMNKKMGDCNCSGEIRSGFLVFTSKESSTTFGWSPYKSKNLCRLTLRWRFSIL